MSDQDNDKPIYVTRPVMPPLEEYVAYLEGIWERKFLTNCGVLHQELEAALSKYLGVNETALFSSCMAGLMAAFPVLDITKGEVITTPFTFVATANAIHWNNLTPVFVDIDPNTLNIDPSKIEAAITPKTKAILAVHCYGRPCDVEAIARIAKKHDLKVIYDAAHVFGVEDEGGGLARHGDLSVLSFHATKVFHTFEGGAMIAPDAVIKKRIDEFKNFGLSGETGLSAIGFNGKMAEVNAAMGLLQLHYIDEAINHRARVYRHYHEALTGVEGLALPDFSQIRRANYAYFPVIVEGVYHKSRDEIFDDLQANNIIARKYFYPSITDFAPFKAYGGECPISKKMAAQVICLPIYPDLSTPQLERIIRVMKP